MTVKSQLQRSWSKVKVMVKGEGHRRRKRCVVSQSLLEQRFNSRNFLQLNRRQFNYSVSTHTNTHTHTHIHTHTNNPIIQSRETVE